MKRALAEGKGSLWRSERRAVIYVYFTAETSIRSETANKVWKVVYHLACLTRLQTRSVLYRAKTPYGQYSATASSPTEQSVRMVSPIQSHPHPQCFSWLTILTCTSAQNEASNDLPPPNSGYSRTIRPETSPRPASGSHRPPTLAGPS